MTDGDSKIIFVPLIPEFASIRVVDFDLDSNDYILSYLRHLSNVDFFAIFLMCIFQKEAYKKGDTKNAHKKDGTNNKRI